MGERKGSIFLIAIEGSQAKAGCFINCETEIILDTKFISAIVLETEVIDVSQQTGSLHNRTRWQLGGLRCETLTQLGDEQTVGSDGSSDRIGVSQFQGTRVSVRLERTDSNGSAGGTNHPVLSCWRHLDFKRISNAVPSHHVGSRPTVPGT